MIRLDYHQQIVDERRRDYKMQERDEPKREYSSEKPNWFNTLKYSFPEVVSAYKEILRHPIKSF